MNELLFGDLVENPAASLDNPQRYGYFVRRGYREGRLNPGPYIELTDARGKFWTCKGDLVVKIGRKDCPALPSTVRCPYCHIDVSETQCNEDNYRLCYEYVTRKYSLPSTDAGKP